LLWVFRFSGAGMIKTLKSPPVLIGLIGVAIVVVLDLAGRKVAKFDLLQRIEWITYDWRMRQASRMSATAGTNFGFVAIGNETIDVFSRGELHRDLKFGLYWPRHIYGRLVSELSAQGAKAIALDVLFAEPRPDHPPVLDGTNRIPSDEFFRSQLQRTGNVVLGAERGTLPYPPFRRAARAMGDISTTRDSDGVLRRVKAFQDYRVWHEAIRKEARLSRWDLDKAQVLSNQVIFTSAEATNTLPLTEDGLFDPYDLIGGKPPGGFSRLFPAFEQVRVWNLGIVMAAVELGFDLSKANVDLERGRITFAGSNGVARVLPVHRDGSFLIDWTMGLNDPRLTQDAFESVIASGLLRQLGSNAPPRFQNKLVVVGSTAVGNDLTDRGATPLERDTFLTSNNWNVMNSLITNRFVRELPAWAGSILIALLGAAGSLFACKLSAQRAAVSAAVLALVYVVAAAAAFILARYWLPMVTPLIALFLCYAALVTYQALFEQTERQRIRGIFARIVSPNIVQELLQAQKPALGGARRQVTVLFADIRGFTEITDASHERAEAQVKREELGPQQAEAVFDAESQLVLKTVNQYLSIVADTVKSHDGTLDKYIGDCVMAFWGAPSENPRHAVACVQAAIEAHRAVHRLNETRRQENRRREQENADRVAAGRTPSPLLDILSIGTGINTGPVVVGLMGSDAHIQNYTVFGREVNVASRLEKLAGSDRILIGEATHNELKKESPALAASCIELPPTAVRGIRDIIKIYEVPWQESRASDAASV
jgi:class 3 adenylate cyclase/CHASE2 domain-containing sensor protein